MLTTKVLFLPVIFSLALFSNCSSEVDSNKQANINFTQTIDGLEITLIGSAIDTDDTLVDLIINWGDGGSKSLASEFLAIEEAHTYDTPDNYTVELIVINDKGDSASQSINITVDYSDTSLAEINATMSKASSKELLILTLNMHTYQENNQNAKFKMITDVIGGLDVDFVLLQECAQHKNATVIADQIKEDNMTKILKNSLKESYNADYNATWDWAHYGWDVWEEGVAIMSKHELTDTDSRYVSSSKTTSSITSRKVIYGSYAVPGIGDINMFSAHTHWRTSETSQEQNNQMRSIHAFLDDKEVTNSSVYSFVAGDFNGNPTSDSPWSEGYTTMVGDDEYEDTFLAVSADANNRPAKSKYHTVLGDFPGRIDYIFMKQNEDFEVIDSQIIFTDSVVGKVSDHFGVLTKVRYK